MMTDRCKNLRCLSVLNPISSNNGWCFECSGRGVPELIARAEAAEALLAKLLPMAKYGLRIAESSAGIRTSEGEAVAAAIAEAERLGTHPPLPVEEKK